MLSPDIDSSQMKLDRPVRLGVMASGSGTNFEALLEAIADGRLNAKIEVLIYNNPDAKVRDRARRWQIPSELIDHRKFDDRHAFDTRIVETLKQYEVEWIVMAGWMRKATEVLIDAFRDRIINIHPSLLPSFPGTRAVEKALKAGVKITGCTVHIARLEVDNGPILMQAAVPILPDDTPATLHDRIQIQEREIFWRSLMLAVWQERNSSAQL